jgi:hypothetical protein
MRYSCLSRELILLVCNFTPDRTVLLTSRLLNLVPKEMYLRIVNLLKPEYEQRKRVRGKIKDQSNR